MENNNNERLLQTMDDFALLLGVSIETVRVWVRKNQVPSFKIGKRRLINVRKLKKMIDESEIV
ncbi:helix-turn-helix domain-containing protein [Endozoicomonas sp. OPT23]|uniref:helix-turn-helix domain-containing protein n=1 Tax=Endozoicomonas sp. OPT23 TaxID=2072845 RepID=UPI00129AF7B2|nr:helix-turn-helix domain-containing protein [Endozoicomonas sp. OPT23]MRI32614.1 helix-turn-helix domain-containing protein [Endozoicomonas sp. OPT23]